MSEGKKETAPRELLIGRALQARGHYRRFLAKRFEHFTLAGLITDDEPVLLRQIYVPLMLTPQPISDQAPEAQIQKDGRSILEWFEEALADTRDVAAPLPARIFFVAGEAGSGKTTLVTTIVASIASSTVADDFNQRFDTWLPFPILLREAPIDQISSLDELIRWWLEEAKLVEPDLSIETVLDFLGHGHGFLLLDGLDEVGSLARRRRVLSWLDHRWVRGRNLTVVTARPSGFEGIHTMRGVLRLHVAPFSVEQIRTFLTRWFELRPLSPTRRHEQIEALIQRLVKDDRLTSLHALSRRPAYLTSLAFVHGTRGALPHTRVALYDSLVDAYVDLLDRQRGILNHAWDRQEKREVLAAVAWDAHVGATMDTARLDRRFSWSRGELVQAVARAIEVGKSRFRTIAPLDAEELTDYYLARTGLLVERSEGRYQFGHLSFQEYLAALYALDQASGRSNKAVALRKILLDNLDKPGWIEVTLLALAVDATRTRGRGHRAVLDKLDSMQKAHVAFVGEVLSSEEVPLESEERRAWVIAYLLKGSERLLRSDHVPFVQLDANRSALEEAWHAVAGATVAQMSVWHAMQRLVQPALEEYDDEIDPIDAPRRWMAGEPGGDEERLSAAVLLLPLRGDLVPCNAQLALLRIAEEAPLFGEERGLQGIPPPRLLWSVLNAWAGPIPGLTPTLAASIPVGWLCADDTTWWPATILSRWTEEQGDALENARKSVWKLCLSAERRIHVCTLACRGGDGPDAVLSDLALARERARDLTLDRVRDLDLALDLALARERAPAVALARALALALARDLARDRDRDRTRARARDLNQALAREQNRDRDVALLDAWSRNPPPQRSWRERTAALIRSFFLSVTVNHLLGDPAPEPRSAIEAERATLADPNFLARDLPDPAQAAQFRAEWADLVRSPLSPIPMLDAVLATDFEVLDASTATITADFERLAAALLAELDS